MDGIGKSLEQNVGQMWGQYCTSLNAPRSGSGEVSSKMLISSSQCRQWSCDDGCTLPSSGVVRPPEDFI